MSETAERVGYTGVADNYVFNRQLKAYEITQSNISDTVLEIGSGDGYGLKLLAPQASIYYALDKFPTPLDQQLHPNVKFIQATVPPLSDFENDSIDTIVSFQLIEHIQDDVRLISEMKRVLKPGGKLYLTTPNIKTTLSRNPWHIREYTTPQLEGKLAAAFDTVEMNGIYGDDLVMKYYAENKLSVQKVMKYDILNLQYRLPRWVLQAPYDYMNRRNRAKLSKNNTGLVSQITTDNFYVDKVSDECLDFYVVATA